MRTDTERVREAAAGTAPGMHWLSALHDPPIPRTPRRENESHRARISRPPCGLLVILAAGLDSFRPVELL